MKYVLISLLTSLLLTARSAPAQDGSGRQKIESAKIALITNRLNLTPEQAAGFWPVYNEYNAKKQELNRRIRQLSGQSPAQQNLAGEAVLSDLREVNATKQKLADLDDEYLNRFLKVISPQQVKELYNTERMFNKMLLEKLNNPNR